MTCRLAALVVAAALLLISAAFAQAPVRGPSDYAAVSLNVACGSMIGAPCTKVLPKIAARTGPTGLELKPLESMGALDAAAAVCDGRAALAIVQRDAIPLVAQQKACQGRYDSVSRALYPYYAFLVVKAGSPYRQFDDVASLTPDGRQRTIAAGPDGSGGQITLGYLLRDNPAHQLAVAVSRDDFESALARIASGTTDGFFSVETLESARIDRVRLAKDAGGKPLFAFIDIRAGKDFFALGDGAGHCLYRLTALDFGGTAPVTTVSVEAVFLPGRGVGDSHARGGPRASDALSSAIEQTQAQIVTEMKAPRDWRPSSTSCK